MQLEQMNLEQLQTEEKNLLSNHQQFLDSSLKLDLTRGKPSAEQLSLSEGMVGPVSYTHLTLPTICSV